MRYDRTTVYEEIPVDSYSTRENERHVMLLRDSGIDYVPIEDIGTKVHLWVKDFTEC